MARKEVVSTVPADAALRSLRENPDRPDPEQGRRLMRAFFNIRDEGLREAIVNFVTDLSAKVHNQTP